MQIQYIFCVYITILTNMIVSEKFQYIVTEHPTVTNVNPKYLSFANVTSRRHGRVDPFYYVDFHLHTLHSWANNVTIDFYFYEWLTNVYKRGFVEMHFKACDLVHNDQFLGSSLRQGRFAQPCPFPAGEYHLFNMSIPVKQIPPHFPFRKGRIYANFTATDANELIGTGHIDMEIKDYNSRSKKKN